MVMPWTADEKELELLSPFEVLLQATDGLNRVEMSEE